MFYFVISNSWNILIFIAAEKIYRLFLSFSNSVFNLNYRFILEEFKKKSSTCVVKAKETRGIEGLNPGILLYISRRSIFGQSNLSVGYIFFFVYTLLFIDFQNDRELNMEQISNSFALLKLSPSF